MRASSSSSLVLLLVSSLVAVAAIPACGSSSSDSPGDDGGSSSGSSSGASGSSSGSGGSSSSGGSGSSSGLNFTDSGQPDAAGCATATATATRRPVYMLFVLDGSGSMKDNGKWPAAVGALEAIFDDMKTKADTGVGTGLIVFSDLADKSCVKTKNGPKCSGPYPGSNDVPIAFVDATQDTALKARITLLPDGGADTPNDGTPTNAALTGGYGDVGAFTPSAPLDPGGKKVLVLITDGVPTDGCATNGDGSDDYPQNACVKLAGTQLAGANGVETFVIGVGVYPTSDFTNFDPKFLGNLAVAGGSAPANCNPNENAASATDLCYFEVDPSKANGTQLTQAFEDATNAIRGQVASCTFALQLTDAGAVDPQKVNVNVNGVQVPQDPNNGWTYDDANDPTEVILHGTACDTVKNTPNSTVDIVLGCATVVAK